MKSFSTVVVLTKEIRLRYDQNIISLNFGAANLRNFGCNNLFYKPEDYRSGLDLESQKTDFRVRPGFGATLTSILPV